MVWSGEFGTETSAGCKEKEKEKKKSKEKKEKGVNKKRVKKKE